MYTKSMEEKVIAKFHPHFLGFMGSYVTGALVLISPLFFAPLLSEANLDGQLAAILYTALVFAGVLILLATEVSRRVQTYSITDAGIEYRYSFIARRAEFVEYESIEEIRIEQGIIDRIFGIGTVIIETAGEATRGMEIHRAPEPGTIEQIVRSHMRENPKRE